MEELAKEMREELLLEEAKRCLKCKVAKCKKACPISTDIPTIMNLFLEGNKQEAGRVLFENNPLSAICSIVCPHENNCKGNCILGMKKTSVDFYKIEQYLSGKYIDDFDIALPSRKRFESISLKSVFFASSAKCPLAVCRYGYGCLSQNLLKNISFKVLAVLPNVKLHLDKEFDCSHTDVLQRRILQYQSIFRR